MKERFMESLEECRLCPRNCGTNRLAGNKGVCGADSRLFVARAALHFWEEPCISGDNGSGTVFFCGCSLHCIYCQNQEISQKKAGKEISIDHLAEIFLSLQQKGAHNINLVTPTHYIPHIITAIDIAKTHGLYLPIVYNTSGYEKAESLRLLDGIVDIYLPDFKYKNSEYANKYSAAPDYFHVATTALDEMVRQAGPPKFDNNGIMKSGVIVRHLLLPGLLEDSKSIIRFLYRRYKDKIFISLMNQYTPMKQVEDFSPLNRKLSQEEYEQAVEYAISLGVENGYIQEGDTAKESFIPSFDNEGI